jgi:hypothetical protein
MIPSIESRPIRLAFSESEISPRPFTVVDSSVSSTTHFCC